MKAGAFKAGEAKAGEAARQVIVLAPSGISAKAGSFKAGEHPTGDTATDAYATWGWDTGTPTIDAAGAATLTAPTGEWAWQTPTPVLRSILTLSAPTQTWGWDTPTATITGAGDVTLSPERQTWGWDTPETNIGYSLWVIDGTPVRVQSVTATPTGWSLSIRGRSDAERALFDRIDANDGNVDARQRADGTTDHLDESGGENTYQVIPAVYSQPPRTTRTMLADDITITRTSADTRAVDVTLELRPADARDPEPTSDASDPDAWTFDFQSVGTTLVTRRVHDVSSEEQTRLRAILEPQQAEAFETTAAAVAGAVVQSVPDGEDLVRDTTPTNRQTVTIATPDSAADPPIADGDFAVTGWSSEGIGGGGYIVEMDIDRL